MSGLVRLALLLCLAGASGHAQTAEDFAAALDRSAAISPCVPSAEHLQRGTIHAIHLWTADDPFVLELGDDLRAVHLIIRHGQLQKLTLDVPDGVEVLSVMMQGDAPTIITGLQDDTLVYRPGFETDGTLTYDRCATDDPLADAVYRAARNFTTFWRDVQDLDEALTRYIGSGLASISKTALATDYFFVSWDDIVETETARRIGAGMLAYLSFPAPPVVNPEPLSPPTGLSSAEFFDWLIESGAAEPASEEAIEFICVYGAALVMAAGFDATHRSRRCTLLTDPWRDLLDRVLVLVRPISVGEYRCSSFGQEFRLYGTEEAPAIGEIINCLAYVSQF